MKKHDSTIYTAYKKNNFKYEDRNRRKLKQWKKMYHDNSNQIKSCNINSKVDIKSKIITRDKKDHFIMMKWSIHPEMIPILRFMYLVTKF